MHPLPPRPQTGRGFPGCALRLTGSVFVDDGAKALITVEGGPAESGAGGDGGEGDLLADVE